MGIPIVQFKQNPVTGIFGTGNVQWFLTSGTWYVPAGISTCRVRLWGAGSCGTAATGGPGGGFSLKTITDLSDVTSVVVTVGQGVYNAAGGTSSFGSYCSATSTGVGGDINFNGGAGGGASGGGGGSASLFGNGGAGSSTYGVGGTGGAGGAGGSTNLYTGGSGSFGSGVVNQGTNSPPVQATAGIFATVPSIDFLGTGGGGTYYYGGINGGGSGYNNPGSFPGGGGQLPQGGNGLVIVEW